MTLGVMVTREQGCFLHSSTSGAALLHLSACLLVLRAIHVACIRVSLSDTAVMICVGLLVLREGGIEALILHAFHDPQLRKEQQ